MELQLNRVDYIQVIPIALFVGVANLVQTFTKELLYSL